jgi:hypothetical protein
MPLRLLLSLAALASLLTLGCEEDEAGHKGGVACEGVTAVATDETRGPSQTPDAAAVAEAVAVLERFESSTYVGEYSFCSNARDMDAQATVTLTKDGLHRARTDARFTVDGNSAELTRLAIVDEYGFRGAWCSSDFGGYLRLLGGLVQPGIWPGADQLHALRDACVDAEYDADDISALGSAGATLLLPPYSGSVRDTAHIWLGSEVRVGAGQFEGDNVICITSWESGDSKEFCFNQAGRLVRAAWRRTTALGR